jgi:N-acetylglucosaminyldiphosphoundecaprenol N-acetyl-beta-D-mannosaminyltransferase
VTLCVVPEDWSDTLPLEIKNLSTTQDTPQAVRIFGIRFHKLTLNELLESILRFAKSPEKQIIAHVNIKAMNLVYQLPWYRDFMNAADLVFCDGVGVVLGARLLGYALQTRHRMTCPDWIEQLGIQCASNDVSLFLLAGFPGVAESAAQKLKDVAPALKISSHHGYFTKSGPENTDVIEIINDFNPDILYIGLGMPLQEKWIAENYDKIHTRLFLPLGACLDFYTGDIVRAPRWMTDHGLEWLGRILTEPRRLWKRYLVGNPLFLLRVLKQRLGFIHLDERE